ncbi:MAG: S8 family serine peptidase [Myxococcales bacterium]|nr:S8 family serine peptidase [Myxococcota bacterium]MDW8284337.1 S8 family serine peptidase [Myxococcales bacterium]
MVAVLDTGLSLDHPALQGIRLAACRSFVGGDPHQDVTGHGTGCCGILVARPGLGGPAGLSPGIALLFGQIMGKDGRGTVAALCEGLRCAVGADADLIALPSGVLYEEPVLRAAVAEVLAAGVRLLAAAGNPFVGQTGPLYPAAYPGVLCVGAAAYRDLYAAWSRPPDVVVLANRRAVPMPGGTWREVSGTSLAVMIVAGLLATRGGVKQLPVLNHVLF